MKRIHALIVALAIAVAAVVGAYAATRSVELGATPRVSQAELARKSRALDRAEAALRRQAAQQPPALPPISRPGAPAAQPQAVIYRRPPAVVRVVPRGGEHGDDDHGESEHGEELDD